MENYRPSGIIFAIIGYFGVVFIILYPLFSLTGTHLVFGDDIHRSYYFFMQYLISSIKSGIIPWWNPYLFSGTPFLANPITNAFYPLNWLFFILPATIVYPLSIMVHLLIAMSGMYVLILKFRREDNAFDIAAWGAGVVFGLSSFFSSRIWAGHIDVISSASYMPWVVYLFYRAFESRKPRDIMIAGAILSLQLFAGYHTMAFFTLIAVGVVAMIFALRARNIASLRVMILGVLIGVGIAAISLVPIQQFVARSIRTFDKPYSWSSHGSLGSHELIQLVSPFALGDQQTYTGGSPNYWEHALFIGRSGFYLVILGLLTLLLKKRWSVFLVSAVAISLFGLWESLGHHAPIDLNYWLWRFVPMYHFLRIPARHLLLVIFGFSILGGYGLSTIRNRYIATVIVSIVVVEMIWYAGYFIESKPIPELRHDRELIGLVSSSEPWKDRILPNFGVWVEPRDSLDFDSAMLYKIFSTTGYDSTLLRNYYEFIDAVNGAERPSIMEHDVQVPYLNVYSPYINFLNIRYVLVPLLYDPLKGNTSSKLRLIREDISRGYRLYENLNVSPRMFFVSEALVFPNRQAVASLIRQGKADLSSTVLFNGESVKPPSLEDPCTGEASKQTEVIIQYYDPNEMLFSLTAPCDGYLVTSEVMYPGWEAVVDGIETPIYEGNLAFRTLFIPKGYHTVGMNFVPRIFIVGGFITFITLIASFLWVKSKNPH